MTNAAWTSSQPRKGISVIGTASTIAPTATPSSADERASFRPLWASVTAPTVNRIGSGEQW